ncbi:MAG: ParA family protein [Melioribacteraceae bacterium]|nr:ParA family protein [Melioribacteraceae bacterium]
MKAIATINFKGGVGKTTITWLLAKYIAEKENKKVLVFDTDAQMSLTLAVILQENGDMYGEFDQWYENTHKAKQRTILDSMDKYDKNIGGPFDFPIDFKFIYNFSENLHFVPSVVDLYWLELDVFDREKVKGFVNALLGKIKNSKLHYDYVFFDCPPNFTPLSYSVLSSVDHILIPINPDVFAARGIRLMIDGLVSRIAPWKAPSMSVFLNKAKVRQNKLTQESNKYLQEAKRVTSISSKNDIKIETYDCFIPERVDIKRAIPTRKFPMEFEDSFRILYNNIKKNLGE